jgi:cytochrome P450
VALAVAWCLHLLSKNPRIQTRLREELVCSSLEGLFEEVSPEKLEGYWGILDALPYLDAVVRETLRLCPPVHGTIRVATEDDRIPVSEPITLQDGTIIPNGGCITIRKGSYVHIPIEGLNYSPDIWGPTAQEFE